MKKLIEKIKLKWRYVVSVYTNQNRQRQLSYRALSEYSLKLSFMCLGLFLLLITSIILGIFLY